MDGTGQGILTGHVRISLHPMGLWDGTVLRDVGVHPRVGHVRISLHPMGLWDGTGLWDLGVHPRVGHVRISLTVLFIPWDYGMGKDTGI